MGHPRESRRNTMENSKASKKIQIRVRRLHAGYKVGFRRFNVGLEDSKLGFKDSQ